MRFNISASKLRVAQRLGLVAAQIGLRNDGKYVRAWTIREIARVYFANCVSTALVIPFQAAIGSMIEFERITGVTVGDSLHGADLPLTELHLIDRHIMAYAVDGTTVVPFGRLDVRGDGRTKFVPDMQQPLVVDPLTRAIYYVGRARRQFVALAENIP